jgi:hypothetical protein
MIHGGAVDVPMCANKCSTYARTLTGKYFRRGYTAKIDH